MTLQEIEAQIEQYKLQFTKEFIKYISSHTNISVLELDDLLKQYLSQTITSSLAFGSSTACIYIYKKGNKANQRCSSNAIGDTNYCNSHKKFAPSATSKTICQSTKQSINNITFETDISLIHSEDEAVGEPEEDTLKDEVISDFDTHEDEPEAASLCEEDEYISDDNDDDIDFDEF
jgi:hypothetical protein